MADGLLLAAGISIHTLHTEGDIVIPAILISTIPISIHTLHTEGDMYRREKAGKQRHFNPHPPHGG